MAVIAVPDRAAGAADVWTFGEVMALFMASPGVPLPAATEFRRSIAGSEANVAIGLTRLGHRVAFTTRLGGDAFGEAVLAALRAEGLDTRAVGVDPTRPTGLLLRDVFADRPVEVVYHRTGSAASAMSSADLDLDQAARARVVHLTGITPVLGEGPARACTAAARAARAAGTLVSFDPNLRRHLCTPERAAEVMRPLAGLADIVLAGVDEAELLSGTRGPAVASWFLDRGAQLVVVKEGARGAWATDGHLTVHQPCISVGCADPVGAGDGFAAGLLSAVLRSVPLDQALLEAAAVAACAVQVVGDMVGLPGPALRDRVMAGGPAGVVNR